MTTRTVHPLLCNQLKMDVNQKLTKLYDYNLSESENKM